MKIKNQERKTIVVVCVINRLRVAQAPILQKSLFPLITQSGINIILDLRNVHFIDCCTVSCIITMCRIAQAHHSTITLCNLRGNVKILADILKLSDIIDIDKTNQHNMNNGACNYFNSKLFNIKHI